MTRVLNLLFIGIGLVMIWQIMTAPAGRALQPGDPGPWALPTLLAITLICLGLAEIIRKARKKPVESGVPSPDRQGAPMDAAVSLQAPPPVRGRIIFVVALLVYVALFQMLGFTLSTAGFVFVAVMALSENATKAIIPAVLTAVLTSLAIGWLLAGIVGVPLPGVLLVP